MLKFRRHKNIINRNFLRPIPFTKLIPNIITLIGLIIGVSSIRFAIDSKWESAVYCIIVAAIIDGLDGRIARMLGATSHFGAELDSLCDFVNFGLCPAILIYLWSFHHEYKVISWAAITLFIVCMAIRLARFNTAIIEPSFIKASSIKSSFIEAPLKKPHPYFLTGVPAPAGAILALVPMILDFDITSLIETSLIGKFVEKFDLRTHNLMINCYIMIIALLSASRLPTISLKNLYIKPKYLSLAMSLAAFIIIITFIYPWYAIPAFAFAYLFSIILCIKIVKNHNKISKPSTLNN